MARRGMRVYTGNSGMLAYRTLWPSKAITRSRTFILSGAVSFLIVLTYLCVRGYGSIDGAYQKLHQIRSLPQYQSHITQAIGKDIANLYSDIGEREKAIPPNIAHKTLRNPPNMYRKAPIVTSKVAPLKSENPEIPKDTGPQITHNDLVVGGGRQEAGDEALVGVITLTVPHIGIAPTRTAEKDTQASTSSDKNDRKAPARTDEKDRKTLPLCGITTKLACESILS